MKRVILSWPLVILLTAGCATESEPDPAACDLVEVVIQSPTGPIVEDVDLLAPGLQVSVSVRSTAATGVPITVDVLDETGVVLAAVSGEAGLDGDVRFAAVDLPVGAATLRASAQVTSCEPVTDQIALDVVVGRDCVVEFETGPVASDHYAPLSVLNASHDESPEMPGHQARLRVHAAVGATAELFVTDPRGAEVAIGVSDVAEDGDARFLFSLAEGRNALRAVCRRGGVAIPSVSLGVFVDTVAPVCATVAPAPGATVTPSYDQVGDQSDGVQTTVRGHVEGDGVIGQPVTFRITVDGNALDVAGTAVDAQGDTSASVVIAPSTTPSTAAIAWAVTDHAGNPCSASDDFDVVYDGCTIDVVSPGGALSSDADGDPGNGVQVDVALAVDPACAGRTVTSDCGLDDPTAVVAGDGEVTLRASWCASGTCEHDELCTFGVVSAVGIETTTALAVRFDNQAPLVALQLTAPALPCGASLAPEADIDPRPGVQVGVRVIAPLAATRGIEHLGANGTFVYDATTVIDQIVTLDSGGQTLFGVASDALGNLARTAACSVTLADIVIGFALPASDGVLGRGDGQVNGDALSFELCGTVSAADAIVQVAVDDGAATDAVVAGQAWCATLTATAGSAHTLSASARSGIRAGTASLAVVVDLTPPTEIIDLALIADTHRSVEATWTSPIDDGSGVAGYLVKLATVPLTTGNFATTGIVVTTGAPGLASQLELVQVGELRAGTSYWLGVAAIDRAGNLSSPQLAGPVMPTFDVDGRGAPDLDGDALFGLTMVQGRFDDDRFDDLAVAAPTVDAGGMIAAGAVYVYFGGADGFGAVPDLVIEGDSDYGSFGLSVTTVRWSSTSRDDLVIGEPYAMNLDGRVSVFDAASLVPGTLGVADADLHVSVGGGRFSGAAIGWSLAAPDFDGDGTDDLAIGALGTDLGNGAVAVIYGGTVGGDVELSDASASGATVLVIADPLPAVYDLFANYMFDVGSTDGDATDDLLISYADGVGAVQLIRGGARPVGAGVHDRAFDGAIDLRVVASSPGSIELGSSAASLDDGNGDRELAIGGYRSGGDTGVVWLVDAGAVGVQTTTTSGFVRATIAAEAGTTLFGAAIANPAAGGGGDVDGDRVDDLVVTARRDGSAIALVWYGGQLPSGAVTSSTAAYQVDGPSTLAGGVPSFGGTPDALCWAGDIDDDGGSDLAWGVGTGNGGDGAFAVLWDAQP